MLQVSDCDHGLPSAAIDRTRRLPTGVDLDPSQVRTVADGFARRRPRPKAAGPGVLLTHEPGRTAGATSLATDLNSHRFTGGQYLLDDSCQVFLVFCG